jgi:hypothetical protein
LPSVFGARRRLTTSATATTYGHWAGCSHNPRWDERLDALPFLTCHALSLAEAVTSGEPRIVRSPRPRCRFFLAFTKFARPRYRFVRATSADCSDEVAVAIDVARVRGPSEGRVLLPKRESRVSAFSSPVHALRRVHADVVPFLSFLWTSAVAGAFAERGGDPFSTPDRTKIHVPTLTREGQRHPADRDAFHRCEAR